MRTTILQHTKQYVSKGITAAFARNDLATASSISLPKKIQHFCNIGKLWQRSCVIWHYALSPNFWKCAFAFLKYLLSCTLCVQILRFCSLIRVYDSQRGATHHYLPVKTLTLKITTHLKYPVVDCSESATACTGRYRQLDVRREK